MAENVRVDAKYKITNIEVGIHIMRLACRNTSGNAIERTEIAASMASKDNGAG